LKIRNEVKFGIFALLALILFVVGIKYLQGSKLFGSQVYLYAEYDNVQNLIVSNPIVMKGVRIGKVRNITLDQSKGKVVTELQFDQPVQIPLHAKALIYSTNVLGASAIQITYADTVQTEGYYTSGDTIEGKLKKDLFDIAENVVATSGEEVLVQVGILASELNKTVKQFNKILQDERGRNAIINTLEDTRASAANIKRITYSLDSMAQTFVDVTRKTDSIVSSVANNADEIESIITNTKATSDTLITVASDIRKLTADARSTAQTLETAISKIDSTGGTLGLLLNDRELYDNINNISSNVNKLIEDVNERPARYVDDIKLYLFERKPPKQKRRKQQEEAEDSAPNNSSSGTNE